MAEGIENFTAIQDVKPRSEIGLPDLGTPEMAVVTRYTDYRAWCGPCGWTSEPSEKRRCANADMRKHNKEFHGV